MALLFLCTISSHNFAYIIWFSKQMLESHCQM